MSDRGPRAVSSTTIPLRPWLRSRNLLWPALAFIALMAMPPGAAIALMLVGVVARGGLARDPARART